VTRDRWYTLGGTTRPGPVPRVPYGRAGTAPERHRDRNHAGEFPARTQVLRNLFSD